MASRPTLTAPPLPLVRSLAEWACAAMKVLIVTKEVEGEEGELRSISGLLEDGTKVRLLNRHGTFWAAGIHFEVGEVWRVQGETKEPLAPTYAADVHISRFVGKLGTRGDPSLRVSAWCELDRLPAEDAVDRVGAEQAGRTYRYPPIGGVHTSPPIGGTPTSPSIGEVPTSPPIGEAPTERAATHAYPTPESGSAALGMATQVRAPSAAYSFSSRSSNAEKGSRSRRLLATVALVLVLGVSLAAIAWRWSHAPVPEQIGGREAGAPETTGASAPSPTAAASSPIEKAPSLSGSSHAVAPSSLPSRAPPTLGPEPLLPPAPAPAPRQRPSPQPGESAASTGRGSSCDAPLRWEEARSHVGLQRAVAGTLEAVTEPRNVRGNPVWLDLGGRFPDADRFTAVIWQDYKGMFPLVQTAQHVGKTVCVIGEIGSFRGVPQIILRSPEQLRLLE